VRFEEALELVEVVSRAQEGFSGGDSGVLRPERSSEAVNAAEFQGRPVSE
jgi:hypothetical protein